MKVSRGSRAKGTESRRKASLILLSAFFSCLGDVEKEENGPHRLTPRFLLSLLSPLFFKSTETRCHYGPAAGRLKDDEMRSDRISIQSISLFF